jgi:hypothetical protein
MKFYHRTNRRAWKKIQKEGILFGRHIAWSKDKIYHEASYRYTYLSPFKEIHKSFGPVLLEVEYTPVGNKIKVNGKVQDNYGFDPPPGLCCWQFSVFIPIPLCKVKIVES